MNVKHGLVFAFLFTSVTLFCQTSFRIKVVDSKSKVSIPDAVVFIEEIPIGDKYTDQNGFVSYKNIPEDRKVRIHVRKPGYLPTQLEVVGNRDIGPDNNVVIPLEEESAESQKIIWGEVTFPDGRDIEGAVVELNLAGRTYSTMTDNGGNYRMKISSKDFLGLQTFRIEVKKIGCKTYRKDVAITVNEIINNDVQIDCTSQSSKTSSESSLKNGSPSFPIEEKAGDLIVKIIDISKSGNGIVIKLKLYNDLNKSTTVGINAGPMGEWSTKINNEGDIIYSTKAKVGNTLTGGMTGFTSESLSNQAWINCFIYFDETPNYDRLELLQIYVGYVDQDYQYYPIILRNLPVN